MKIVLKIIAGIAALVVIAVGVKTYGAKVVEEVKYAMMSDEEKIEQTIIKFNTAFREGDYEGTLRCFTPESRSYIESSMNIQGNITSGILGSFSKGILGGSSAVDIWRVGTQMTDLRIKIKDIKITSKTTADVDVLWTENGGKVKKNRTMSMEKVGKDWLIQDK